MKNLSKIFGNAFDPKRLSVLSKRLKRWDLLFIDDHGKVVSFQYVRGLLILFTVIILILLAVSLHLYYLQKNAHKKNSDLQNTLEDSQQKTKELQKEIRTLMIWLAEAQSKIPKSSAQKDLKPVKHASAHKNKVKAFVVPQVEAGTEKQKNIASQKSKRAKKAPIRRSSPDISSEAGPQMVQEKKNVIPASSEKKKTIDVYDLIAFYDPELNAVNARFLIKKASGISSYVSGYIYVIMKGNDHDQKGWFPLPWIELVSGKPSRIKEGQFFKIRNYKTVELRSVDVTGPKTFTKATVLVFSPSGELLLEKTFPVIVSVAGIPAKATVPEAETVKPAKVSPAPEEIQQKSAIEQGPGLK